MKPTVCCAIPRSATVLSGTIDGFLQNYVKIIRYGAVFVLYSVIFSVNRVILKRKLSKQRCLKKVAHETEVDTPARAAGRTNSP